ncbi:MAG: hypothetical protein DMD61_07415 [Gemmatimonadetes bacterium]|nr:MAG: hypothetical protein DMD61_07415 [Gemmatimonadota bacterium]
MTRLFETGTSMNRVSGARWRRVFRKALARVARSWPTLINGTICQSSLSVASRAAREYEMPPHSSMAGWAGSRPWIVSHTMEPITPSRFRPAPRCGA